MRWIDGSSPAEEGEGPGQDVLTAVLRNHSRLMETVEHAHDAASAALSEAGPLTGAAPPSWQETAEAHARRSSAYAERRAFTEQIRSFSPKALSSLTSEDVRALEVRPARSAALQTPSRILAETAEAALRLPSGESGISHPPLPFRIGIIGDDTGWARFEGQAALIRLTPENWRHYLPGEAPVAADGEDTALDLVLVTAPFGRESGWTDGRHPRPELLSEVLSAFRQRQIPTVFTALAEPMALDRFGEAAASCDHVFTPRAESLDSYRSRCSGAQSIQVLPGSVNPLIHTPIGSRPAASDMVLLAGTPPERISTQVGEYAEPLIEGITGSARPAALLQDHGTLQIPAHHAPATFRRLPVWAPKHEALPRLLRGLDIAAAVSAQPASQTAVEQRVLELQACGTVALSTYGQGLNSYYPQVYIANDAGDVASTIDTMSLEEIRRAQNDGLRKVFRDNHSREALRQICVSAGLDAPSPEERVVAVAEQITPRLQGDMDSQTLQVELLTWDELRLDEEQDQITMLMPVSPSLQYSPNYALDQLTSFAYQEAGVVTKLLGTAEETDMLAHRHHAGAGAEEVFSLERSAWWRPDPVLLESPASLAEAARSRRIYATDHIGLRRAERLLPQAKRRSFEEVLFGDPPRRSLVLPQTSASGALSVEESPSATPSGRRSPHELAGGEDMAAAGEQIRSTSETLGLELSVVVPIYNNGDHLRHKAFASLRRSSIFERMHVLLINDGSTDPGTTDTIEELAAAWPNVSAFHHPRGGSGSASRPRNTGLALTHTPYVTYLDPDDEELADGYSELLETLKAAPEANFALGNMAVWTNRLLVQDYHDWFSAGIPQQNGLFRPEKDSLVKIRFRPASIEAMVARTDWLQSLGLEQPVGAVGQDTFFFQQLLYHTYAYVPVFRPVYTYYGAVETSIVNVVSPNYFRKYLRLEQARAAWLEEVGLKQSYLETRFEPFFITWYLRKLDQVPEAQRAEAAEVLHQIADLYGTHRWKDLEARRFFKRYPRHQLNDPSKDA